MAFTSHFIFVQVLPTQSHNDHSIKCVFKSHAHTQQVQSWTAIRKKSERYITNRLLNSIQ